MQIEIKNMSTIERLKTMEAIWDSLLYDGSEIDSPEWHNRVLAERKKKIKDGSAEFISIKDLKANYNL